MNGGTTGGGGGDGEGDVDGVVRVKDAETETWDGGPAVCPKPLPCSFAACHIQKGKTALEYASEKDIDLLAIQNAIATDRVYRGEG